MNNEERLNLKKLVNEMDCENNTDNIRKLKHSEKIRDDIRKMELLKLSKKSLYETEPAEFNELCKKECSFLYTNYTDLFNKVIVGELNLDIMAQMLYVLKLIEEEQVDQHEGSAMVGKILKELYIDSAIKRGEKLDKENELSKPVEVEEKKISWNTWKKNKMMP
jgi:hypothetical protein